MKDAKILLIIKNVDIELAEKIQKLINNHNAEKAKKPHKKPYIRAKGEIYEKGD